ncbi:MAG: sigma 54-interacting transcriptional regulator [bacterium]
MGRRRGNFELADTGTLFLDESAMSLSAQAKCCGVLQTGEMTRVGGETPVQVDVRVLAATNKDLEQACRGQLPRGSVLPPPTWCPADAAAAGAPGRRGPAGRALRGQVCAENGFRPKGFGARGPPSPGGLRLAGERARAAQHGRAAGDPVGEQITVDDLPTDFSRRSRPSFGVGEDVFDQGSLRDFREAAEQAFIAARLAANEWNISRTAESLDLERTNLHKKIKALGIKREG